jgi:hypothetical protein
MFLKTFTKLQDVNVFILGKTSVCMIINYCSVTSVEMSETLKKSVADNYKMYDTGQFNEKVM